MRILTIFLLYLSNANFCIAQAFYTLPPGFDFEVRTLYYDSTFKELFAGGPLQKLFDSTGNGLPVNYVAKWSNNLWSSIDGGFSGHTFVLIKHNTNIMAGGVCGKLDSTGISYANYLTQYNGAVWSNFDSLIPNSAVYGMLSHGNDIYIGGSFTQISGTPAVCLAKYNGTTLTIFPGFSTNDNVTSLIFYNNTLFAGGNFLGTGTPSDFAFWDSSNFTWQQVGTGFSGAFSGVNDLKIFQNKLYVCGLMRSAAGDPGDGIAYWDGFTWHQLGSGIPSGVVNEMHVFNNQLWVGGSFSNAGGVVNTQFLAIWDGSQWLSSGHIFDNTVNCFSSSLNDIYVGGGFNSIDGLPFHKIAKYSLGTGYEKNNKEYLKINILPTLVTNELNILFNRPINNKNVRVEIYDNLGKLCFQNLLTEPTIKIRLPYLQAGLYHVKVTHSSGCLNGKFIKK